MTLAAYSGFISIKGYRFGLLATEDIDLDDKREALDEGKNISEIKKQLARLKLEGLGEKVLSFLVPGSQEDLLFEPGEIFASPDSALS